MKPCGGFIELGLTGLSSGWPTDSRLGCHIANCIYVLHVVNRYNSVYNGQSAILSEHCTSSCLGTSIFKYLSAFLQPFISLICEDITAIIVCLCWYRPLAHVLPFSMKFTLECYGQIWGLLKSKFWYAGNGGFYTPWYFPYGLFSGWQLNHFFIPYSLWIPFHGCSMYWSMWIPWKSPHGILWRNMLNGLLKIVAMLRFKHLTLQCVTCLNKRKF